MFSFTVALSRCTRRLCTVAAAAMLLLGSSARAESVTVPFVGDGALGDFIGSMTYAYDGGATADLAVFLENTSDPDNGGYLTAFAFNIAAPGVTATLSPNPTGSFYRFIVPIAAAPYGTFEAGAGLPKNNKDYADNFNGSGDPKDGLGVGDSQTFHFTIAGPNLDQLSPLTFLTEQSTGGSCSAVFLARFRGFENGGSDKTEGEIVPLPSAAWAGASLFGLLIAGAVKKKFNQA